MGLRLRLKSSVDISGFPRSEQVVLQALKTYGMIVADNGGDFYMSGAPDPRWDDDTLHHHNRAVLSVRAFDRAGRVASASVQLRVSPTVAAGMQQ